MKRGLNLYKYTDHARKRMASRKIMVGWVYNKNDILVLSVYEVKRKWRQE